MLHEQTGAQFSTTRWTLVSAVRDGDAEGRRRALDEIARMYWPAVYAAFRRRGCGREAAGELTQAFFAEVVVGRGLVERAREPAGSLRSLIRAALGNFHVDDLRRAGRARAAVAESERIDREELIAASSSAEDPGDAFDRRWAMVVVEEALRRCEEYCKKHEMERNWRAYEARYVQPAKACVAPRPLEDLAAEYGWESVQDVSAAVQTVKRRFPVILQEVVTEISGGGEAGAGELKLVLRLLG